MQYFTQKQAELFILDYMIAKRLIGTKQTTFDNMVRHVPASDSKIVKEALEELIRKGFISTKRKHYGVHISLIPRRLEDIRDYIKAISS